MMGLNRKITSPDDAECQQKILSGKLLDGLRETLDAGRGRLRMDPNDLLERIVELIGLEVQRLAEIRENIAAEKRRRRMFGQSDRYWEP